MATPDQVPVQSQGRAEVIQRWAQKLRNIYKDRTAGDYTFEGVLVSFLLDIEKEDEGR